MPATEPSGVSGEWRGLVTTEQIEVGSGRMDQGAMVSRSVWDIRVDSAKTPNTAAIGVSGLWVG